MALAAFFSFLSGFFGTLGAFSIARYFDLTLLPRFVEHIYALAAVLGLLTYIIGALLYQFVKMSNQKDFQQKKLNESRLKSLETQLNPHFLFNALNSLAELIHQDKDKAETAVMELSSFLRTSMKESMLTTFEHEINNLKRYIRLENIRFDDTIVLRINDGQINPKTPLPKFSVQLLVENALKHGFTSSDETFTITVSAHHDHNTTVISVQNSGKPVKQKNFGIGLNNLQERVRMLCKGAVRLEKADPPTYILQIGECDENIVSR
jgi:LytS/YehU family sensor histidine kinase